MASSDSIQSAQENVRSLLDRSEKQRYSGAKEREALAAKLAERRAMRERSDSQRQLHQQPDASVTEPVQHPYQQHQLHHTPKRSQTIEPDQHTALALAERHAAIQRERDAEARRQHAMQEESINQVRVWRAA